jgi:hypothetical protein
MVEACAERAHRSAQQIGLLAAERVIGLRAPDPAENAT